MCSDRALVGVRGGKPVCHQRARDAELMAASRVANRGPRVLLVPSIPRWRSRRPSTFVFSHRPPTTLEPDYERAFSYLSSRVRSRTSVFLFSHVIDATIGELLVRRVKALRATHLPRDTDIEALAEPGSRLAPDLDTKVAAAEILRNQRGVALDRRRAGALVWETDARTLTGELVGRYLQLKARNLL